MKSLFTLPAHFDGKTIVLDADFSLKPNDELIVTILRSESESDERMDWLASSLTQLDKA